MSSLVTPNVNFQDWHHAAPAAAAESSSLSEEDQKTLVSPVGDLTRALESVIRFAMDIITKKDRLRRRHQRRPRGAQLLSSLARAPLSPISVVPPCRLRLLPRHHKRRKSAGYLSSGTPIATVPPTQRQRQERSLLKTKSSCQKRPTTPWSNNNNS